MEAELKKVYKFNSTLPTNYQQLVDNLKRRDNIVQGQMDRLEARLGCHRRNIEGHQRDIDQLSEARVSMVTRMVGYEEKACRCGDHSDRLSDMSYGEPVVVSGPSFRGAPSPSPVPIPPSVLSVQAQDVAVPSSSSSSSNLGLSSEGSFESAQPVVTELVEIVEVDLEVDSEEAWALLDRMDEEVRSQLRQRCKSRKHPEHFLPYPKGHEARRFACQGRRSFQRGGAERERVIQTRNLREGLLGNADVESEHSGSSSGE